MNIEKDYNQIFNEQYQKLNAAQKKAVDTIEGPVMVVAGPGTGKTQILTLRIANILRSEAAGILPENILALTFTNAGVSAMRERLAGYIGAQEAYRVGIYTFHSFCEEQMKEYPEYFVDFAYAQAISDMDRIAIIEDILKNESFEYLTTFASDFHYTKAIISAIEELKREGISPGQLVGKLSEQEKNILADEASYYKRKYKEFNKGDLKPNALDKVRRNEELQKVYALYQEELRRQKKYDFADMIIAVVAALQAHPALHATLLELYQYILVDEHQDTNDGQNQLLELLIDTPEGIAPNLFTVGDDKQAIYRFQGASVENFLHFSQKFSDIVQIDLTENYRSSQPILDTAHTLISGEKDRTHTELVSAGGVRHDTISTHAFGGYDDELAFVAADIETKIASGVDPAEIAVMYLENKNLAAIRSALEKKSIPYVVNSKENLLHDPMMRKLIVLLRAIADPMNDAALGEALLLDMHNVEILDALEILDRQRHGRGEYKLMRLLDRLVDTKEIPLSNPAAVADFAQMIQVQKEKGENLPFLEFFDGCIRESGFLMHVMGVETHTTHLRQIDTLLSEITKDIIGKVERADSAAYRVGDFLRYIETLEEYDIPIDVPVTSQSAVSNGVRLMTAHGSKGLEFEHVYITNAIHSKWDGKKRRSSFDLPLPAIKSSLEDERRLFYVALTRSKQNITISYSTRDADGRERTPTIFLEEIQSDHITHHDKTGEAAVGEDLKEQLFAERHIVIPQVTDTDYIQKKFLTNSLSVSALNNYFVSPVVYFFRNLVRIPETPSKSLNFGNLIHESFDKFFSQCAEQKRICELDDLLTFFQKELDESFLLREHYDEMEKRGTKLLTEYYENYKDDFSHNVATEKRVTAIPLLLDSGEEILLTGIIDKLEFVDPAGLKKGQKNDVRVIDYKTGGSWSKKNKDQKKNLERQVVFYKLLLDSYTEDHDTTYNMISGVLDFVEPNKKGEYEKHEVEVTKPQVEELRTEINNVAKDILSGNLLNKDFPRDRFTKEYLDILDILKNTKK